MWFSVDFHSHVPVYIQIKENIKGMILKGKLKVGDYIPSIRALAKDLGVNVNTVARAYRELEQEGIIHAERGEGYVVKKSVEDEIKIETLEELRRIVKKLKSMGIQKEHIQSILDNEFSNGSN
ncbi:MULTISPECIES: GntR family transcriptional regulator [Fervidobacterium]|uniref:Regulatory protein GntR HTH n=1 Tax=Fervidobacterium nodosum (strain ATCC 35602 / DSM 5306 / Rt17-B1) TaxID=381764 RepID=A7HK61_FERNB|nr:MULTISPECIES: GntR family transcriptional regulator [Fervidobacterium]ABS60294.1 regulatory protein GntR HTH [Fervidobacterium nodosum Rt17-B1]KAF2961430.1 GntR family transcriptional regulator [Fervidobacterium sp. 2310opik-2]PHJ14170.1 GntR family transcriptional regulator [Fervidobacterium sp. SC_NGM5_G05]